MGGDPAAADIRWPDKTRSLIALARAIRRPDATLGEILTQVVAALALEGWIRDVPLRREPYWCGDLLRPIHPDSCTECRKRRARQTGG